MMSTVITEQCQVTTSVSLFGHVACVDGKLDISQITLRADTGAVEKTSQVIALHLAQEYLPLT